MVIDAPITVEDGAAYTFGRNEKGQLGHANASTCDLYKVEIPDKVVHAATGRGHTLLVTEGGNIYSAGDNKAYQCGHTKDTTGFVKVDIKDHFVKVAAGIDFSLGLSKDGKVWSWGNPQYGQLGHGSDQQYIGKGNKVIFEPQLPKLIAKFDGKRITDIQCGSNHSLALDDTGAIYVWGCAGYSI